MARIKKGKVDQKPIIPFSSEDIHNLLKQPDKSRHAGYRDYAIMLMLLSTGMRIGECLNLTISDIGSTASLREQLGHRTNETVEKYLYWSSDDKLEEFQKYSPLDNMEY